MPQRSLLYFIDDLTRRVRSTPPTANGSALNTWEIERSRFLERWGALSQEERDRRIDAAIAERDKTRAITERNQTRRSAPSRSDTDE